MDALLERSRAYFVDNRGVTLTHVSQIVAKHVAALKMMVVCGRLSKLSELTLFGAFALFVKAAAAEAAGFGSQHVGLAMRSLMPEPGGGRRNPSITGEREGLLTALACLLVAGKFWERKVPLCEVVTAARRVLERDGGGCELAAQCLTEQGLAGREAAVLKAIDHRVAGVFPVWDCMGFILSSFKSAAGGGVIDERPFATALWMTLKTVHYSPSCAVLSGYFCGYRVLNLSAALVVAVALSAQRGLPGAGFSRNLLAHAHALFPHLHPPTVQYLALVLQKLLRDARGPCFGHGAPASFPSPRPGGLLALPPSVRRPATASRG
ncbi:hypothetical protein DIPPA_18020 [Diplonema papillatum]|nr:hypothetical protein DIPPA_18020 [Diplonema papillatum]